MITAILIAIAAGVFAIGFGIGYLAHFCKVMPTSYIAPLDKPPYATAKDNVIYVNDEPIATVKDAETAQELVKEMNSLPR